jgi:hypothetical protein
VEVNIFDADTPLDEIRTAFQFLTTDYRFQLVRTEVRSDFKARHFLVYRNDDSKKQLEVCGDTSWFHCEIRRLVDGQPSKYSDKENCIGFESLAILESNNNYEHLDYFAGGLSGLRGVLKNTASLFQRYREFFTTANWIDVRKIQQLRDDDFEKTFGIRPDDSQPTFFGELKKKVNELLAQNGYDLLVDSDELSPFESSGQYEHLIFIKADKRIKICQADWRDDYFIYRIELNGQKVFEIDIRDQDTFKVVIKTSEVLKTIL